MRGGPMHNQYREIATTERLLIQKPQFKNYLDAPLLDSEIMPWIEGHYARSNIKLKNGTVVYIWMGWKE